ncbi:MAG: hypothetical protein ABIX01_00245 [Chitinophagaceae bacterium]
MNTRRKFLLNGSIAATALLVAKPFSSMADSFDSLTCSGFNQQSIVLAHTGNNSSNSQPLSQIKNLKSNYSNLLMLHAATTAGVPDIAYDATMQTSAANAIRVSDYRVIYKGKIKTGIILADNASASFSGLNDLAVYLKEERACDLVVCLSQLGFKAGNNSDDLSLAATSTHIDIIIGGHADNFCKLPVIALNSKKEEVIINHSAGADLALHKIEIGYDNRGRKNSVAITKTS